MAGVSTRVRAFMIADVRGYTAFTQARGDEAAAGLAAVFAQIVREGVEAHGGEVIELRGDEALAVFDSAREAIRAAVELQQTFAHEVAIDPATPLTVGIGIDAGEAIELEGGFRGGALNLAARLCSGAGPGEVLLSRGVAHLARTIDGVVLADHGTLDAKGIDEPVVVMSASAAVQSQLAERASSPSDLPRELDAVTPIVGRDRETRRLAWAWRQARCGAGSAIVVSGPSGIGKTRLAAAGAELPMRDGAAVVYRSFAAGHDLPPVGDGAAAYVVLDDLESAPAEVAQGAIRWAAHAASGAALVIVVFDDERAAPDLIGDARRLAGEGGVLRPAPLAPDAVRAIAALYLGAAVELMPADLLEVSAGVPSRVHETVGAWAHGEASRRLGEAASVAAVGRSDLRSVEQELADRVVDLQLVREQSRLFGARLEPGERGDAPYRGLASFGSDDAEWFFGRERLVADLVARLAGASFLGVVGPSGSGKSSAVRAGLLPAVAAGVLPGSDRWTVAAMRPGEHPLRELDRAVWAALPAPLRERLQGQDLPLRAAREGMGDGERLMLVVDQFEEVFTTCTDEDEQRSFIAALTEAAADPRANQVVVLALRADYYGRCAADPALAELLGANHVLVGQMTADEYRRVIEQPALRAGVRVEPALTDELVSEVVGEPGALPLLSTALLELWQRRDGRTLLLASHVASGGVRGAVARLAEAAYAELDGDQQAVARAVLLRLAGPGEGAAVVRRRVPLSEFDTDRNPTVSAVLDVLTARRLLTVSEGYVEVAHEALLREWPRFQEWLEQDREGRRLHAHLAESAREWQDRGRESGELYRGTRLAAALDWTTQHTLELNELEREFVATSRVQSQRSVRRLRAGLVAVAALLVLALVGGAVALVQRRSAQHEATVALGRQLGAEAVVEPRLDRAMLLAREAVRLDDSAQTEGSLLSTLLRSPSAVSTFTVPITVRPLRLALAEHGRVLVVNDNNGEFRLYDTARHRQIGRPIPDVGGFGGPSAVAPDSDHLLALTNDKPDAAYIDLSHPTAKPLLLPVDHGWATRFTSMANPLMVDPQGSVAYMVYAFMTPTGSETAPYVDAWNLHTGKRTSVVKLPGATGLLDAELVGAPARERLLVLTPSAAVTYAVPSFRILHTVRFHVRNPAPVGTLSPDGRYAAVGSNAAPFTSLDVIDLRTGRITTDSAASGIENTAFSPHGDQLVTSEDNREVQIWSPTSPIAQQTLLGHGGRVTGIAFSADGATLYTSSLDGAVFQWNIGGAGGGFGRTLTTAPIRSGQLVGGLPPLAVGRSEFATSRGATVTVWSTSSRTRLAEFSVSKNPQASVNALAWAPDGTRLLVGWATPSPQPNTRGNGSVDVWRTGGTPTLARRLIGHTGTVSDVAWSANGRVVSAITGDATGPNTQEGWFYLVNASTGHPLGARLKRPQFGDRVAFSPDGTTVATSWSDNRVILYSTSSGRVQRVLKTEGTYPVLAYSPSGQFATGSQNGIVQLWNPNTGDALSRPTQVAPAPTTNISFNPTGTAFVTSGGSDGIPKLWTTATLQQLGSDFPGDPGSWLNQAYTPDGRDIVVVSQTGRAWIWPATLPAWEQHACNVAGRNLTREEWSRYVTGKAYSRIC